MWIQFGICNFPIWAFIHDFSMTLTYVSGDRWILKGLEMLITLVSNLICPDLWFWGQEKPPTNFALAWGIQHLFVHKLEVCLSAMEKSGLPGMFKTWIYQQSIILQMLTSPLVSMKYQSWQWRASRRGQEGGRQRNDRECLAWKGDSQTYFQQVSKSPGWGTLPRAFSPGVNCYSRKHL